MPEIVYKILSALSDRTALASSHGLAPIFPSGKLPAPNPQPRNGCTTLVFFSSRSAIDAFGRDVGAYYSLNALILVDREHPRWASTTGQETKDRYGTYSCRA